MQLNPITGLLEAKIREYQEKKIKYTVSEFQEMNANLETTVASQKALGLGNPEQSARLLSSALSTKMGAQEANALAKVGGVQYIEDPTTSIDIFELSSGSSTFTNSKTYTDGPPLLALVKLTSETREVLCSVGDREQKKAAIPVIPAAIQELARRAKEASPSVEFFTAFMPSWEPAPMKDPALLARIRDTQNNADHWFLIGQAWGGDKELIEEHLINKK